MAQRLQQAEVRLRLLEMQDARDKVGADLFQKKVYSAEFRSVPADYYARSLEERAALLGARSTELLCKTIVFENVAYKAAHNLPGLQCPTEWADRSNSRYYCVVVQYGAKIDTDLVAKAVVNLRQPGPAGARLSLSHFNFQLAPEAVSARLTGFTHNGVAPFGLACALPVVVCQRCLDVSPPRVWMGGGHPDLKLCVGATDLARSLDAITEYVSHSR